MKRHVLAGAILLALATPAVADPSYSGSVTGWFQNPVLKGNLILIDGSSLNQDNSHGSGGHFVHRRHHHLG